MAARELYLEHRYHGRFLKAVKVSSPRQRVVIGSSRDADIRLVGPEISGVHAVIEFDNTNWLIQDMGGVSGTQINGKKIVECSLDQETTISVGEHEIKVYPLVIERSYFQKEDTTSASATHQQVVISRHDRIIKTEVLGATQSFNFEYNGEIKTFAPPIGPQWVEHKLDGTTIKQRLVSLEPQVGKDSFEFNKDDFKSFGYVLVGFLSLVVLSGLYKMIFPEKPQETKVAQLIYDSNLIQKKREKSKAQQGKMTEAQPQQAAAAQAMSPTPSKKTVSTKAISSIKASGLNKLIGKIAVRAGKASAIVQSAGRVGAAGAASIGPTSTTIGGKFEGAKGDSYRVGKVGTGGKAGGAQGYQVGSGLSGAGVGTGDVGIIEEETIVDGGLDPEVIASVIKTKLGEVRYCYERHLSANPNLQGKVAIKFTIGSVGAVVDQSIGTTTLNNANVEGCILRRVALWKFPTPKGGTSVIVTYPFLFKSLN